LLKFAQHRFPAQQSLLLWQDPPGP